MIQIVNLYIYKLQIINVIMKNLFLFLNSKFKFIVIILETLRKIKTNLNIKQNPNFIVDMNKLSKTQNNFQ